MRIRGASGLLGLLSAAVVPLLLPGVPLQKKENKNRKTHVSSHLHSKQGVVGSGEPLHPRWGGADPATGTNSSKHQGYRRSKMLVPHALYNIPSRLGTKETKKFEDAGLRWEFGNFSSPRAPAAPQTAELMPWGQKEFIFVISFFLLAVFFCLRI